MKTNSDKYHLTVSSNDVTKIQIGDFPIKSSSSEKFLGVNFNSKLNFDSHVKHLTISHIKLVKHQELLLQ